MSYQICLMLAMLATALPGCSGERTNSGWDNIDYSRIARDNYARENDVNYTPPTVIGCVDDDLYNCNPKTR